MRLTLHAGTHKTGTSTIQRVLHHNRDAVAGAGLYYPDPGPWFGEHHVAHHPVAHAVARDQSDAVRPFLEQVAVDAGGRRVLLSAEAVYRHVLAGVQGGWWRRHRAYLDALAGELVGAGFEPEVVLVFRRRDEFVESVYHERVAHGFGEPFEGLLDHADRLLDYDRQVRQFRHAFPRLRTLPYEGLAGPHLVEKFLEHLGVPPPVMEEVRWERRSVDARFTLWMATRFRDDPDPELVTQRRRFSKNPVSHDLVEDWGRVTLWDDPHRRRALLDAYDDDRPVEDGRAPARLTADLASRIDAAFDEYLVAKGLSPVGRAAGKV